MNLRNRVVRQVGGLVLAGALAGMPPAAAAEPIRAPLVTEAEPVELPPVTHRTLENGLELWIAERTQQPIALFQLVIPRGDLLDPPGKEGLASFTAQLLQQGTESRSAEEIAGAMDFVGGSLSAGTSAERTTVSAAVLSKDAGFALDLLADVVLHPTFPEREVEILRNQFLGGVRQERDDSSQLASTHAAAFFYGAGHRLGRPESEASVQVIGREDVVAFHRDHYGPKGAMLIAVGDLDPAWVEAAVRKSLGSWKGPAAPAPSAPEVPQLEESRVRWVAKPGQTQVQIRLRQNGPARTANDWLAVQVYNYVLGGGGFSSRLMQVVRSELGQTYGIGTGYTAYRFPGGMQLGTFTRNDSVWATLDAIRQELGRFRDEGISEAELAAAKSHLLGSFPLQMETLSGMAGTIAEALFYDGTLDAIRTYPEQVASLTRAQVNAAIKAHLDPERFAVVLLGDPAVLEEAPGGEVLGVPVELVEQVDWQAPVEGFTLAATAQSAEGD
ncbi:M16 family metallopeptidase [Limnochorda pilosa]|uniref:Peptidase M16 domain protein n=1 Tax=Limnochorda pilosa TaxID=1555112 RepID=A0A0K2SHR2_LIMPI|nr:pitrilysin family protein [Limnochorda pilosa]BAS26630.1 peptidase M16 domain protein [Limnochorda pilosa]